MNNFNNLLNEPLPSVKKKLLSYVEETYNDDIDVIGFLKLEDDVITEVTLDDKPLKLGGKKAKDVIVTFRSREGWKNPHLHLENKQGFHCAIRINVPEYFIHGPYTDKLSNNQKKIFNEFMQGKAKGNDVTRWEVCVMMYNLIYGDTHPFKIKTQPDYTKLP